MQKFAMFRDIVMKQAKKYHPKTPNTFAMATLLYALQISWFPDTAQHPSPAYKNRLEELQWFNTTLLQFNQAQGVASIFLKNPDRDRDEIQDWILLQTKTETSSRMEVFFWTKTKTRSRSISVIPGGYESRKKARVNSCLRGSHPPHWPPWRCNTSISLIFCNYSFKIDKKKWRKYY